MADKKKSILLRIPKELADALQRWAASELRSVNAQIEYVLREAVRAREGPEAGGSERLDATSFWHVFRWVPKVIAELKGAGLTDWATQLEDAIGRADSPQEVADDLREVFDQMQASDTALPYEAAALVKGLDRVLWEFSSEGRSRGGE